MNETGTLDLSGSYNYIEGCDTCVILDDGRIYNPAGVTRVKLYSPVYNYVHDSIILGLFLLLIIGLILGSCLIYRKHKGEKGLWKKIVKWDLIFFFIMIALLFIIGFILRIFRPRGPILS